MSFLDKLVPEKQNCQFALKFGTSTNSNLQNSVAPFSFSVLDGKHLFWTNLVQKFKIFSLNWNLVPRIIRICGIQRRSSLFYVLHLKHPFWENLVSKIKIVSLSRNLLLSLIRICRLQWCCSLFLFYIGNIYFGKLRRTKRDYCLCDITRVVTLK